jgi:hypothetical protein
MQAVGLATEVIGISSSNFRFWSRWLFFISRPARPKKGSLATSISTGSATCAISSLPFSIHSWRKAMTSSGLPMRTNSRMRKSCMRAGSMEGS